MEKIKKAFPSEATAIVYACTVGYVPIMNVSIRSLIDHCSDVGSYDIVVLSADVDEFDRVATRSLAYGKTNVSIRFFDPSKLLEGWMNENMTVEETLHLSRVLVPWIVDEHDKILLLGADTIMKTDVLKLCRESIPDKKMLLAAVKKGGLDIDIMLMDARSIRSKLDRNDMICQMRKNVYHACEKIYKNLSYPLDKGWNIQPSDVEDVEQIDTICAKANIIHYKGMSKPWMMPMMMMAEDWWAVARRTEYYEEILRRMSRIEPDNRSGLRVLIDEILPKGTRRRAVVKRIVKPFSGKGR